MALDRTAALRNAEKLLRLGKLEAAIAEYERLVADQPRDWNATNTLGDLYVRTGQVDRAVEQFARIADSLALEGFVPKANAIYKKILKLQPQHERALLRAGECAAELGLMADARTYFGSVLQRRQERGDARAISEVRVLLGGLEGADLDTRAAGATARADLGDKAGAAQALAAIAQELTDRGLRAEALEYLKQASQIDPTNANVRQRLAHMYADSADFERAMEYASDGLADAPLLIKLATSQLQGGRADDGLTLLQGLLEREPAERDAIVELGLGLSNDATDLGFRVTELVVDRATTAGDVTSAVTTLERFAERHAGYRPALMRLVEVALDAGLEAPLYRAQAKLADAYVDAGMVAEARFIAEDLVTHEPDQPSHVERLRRVLALEGESDPDAIVAERQAGRSSLSETELLTEVDQEVPVAVAEPEAPAPIPVPEPPRQPRVQTVPERPLTVRVVHEPEEIDLSIDLDDILRPAPPMPAPIQAESLDAVFEHLRGEASRRPSMEAAQAQYARGVALRDTGDIDGCVDALKAASRAPGLRFAAASTLARIFRERGEVAVAVEWFERGAEAPAPSREEAHALLYELADTLEGAGEVARSLAVCLELQADAGVYRDLDQRIGRLTELQARG